MNTNISTRFLAAATFLVLPVVAGSLDAQRTHNITVTAGKVKSARLTSQIARYSIQGGGNVVQASFDRNTNRLRFRGLQPGRATIVFSGTKVRYVAGITRRGERLRRDVPFQDVVHVTVRPDQRARPRNGGRNRGRRDAPPRRRAPRRAPAPRKLPTIYRNYSKELGKGRRGSMSLSKIFGGAASSTYALSSSRRGVVSAYVHRGRLRVEGKRRGVTTLRIRGKARIGGKVRDVMVTFAVRVR